MSAETQFVFDIVLFVACGTDDSIQVVAMVTMLLFCVCVCSHPDVFSASCVCCFVVEGCSGCGFAFFSFFLPSHKKHQIIGIENEPIQIVANSAGVLRAHFSKLNQHKYFKDAPKVFMPEANMKWASSCLHVAVSDIPNVKTCFLDDNTTPGVYKGHVTTGAYAAEMSMRLSNDMVRIENDLITASTSKTAEEHVATLREQLERFHKEITPAGKVTFTAKGGTGMNDDVCICALMLPHHGRRYREGQIIAH